MRHLSLTDQYFLLDKIQLCQSTTLGVYLLEKSYSSVIKHWFSNPKQLEYCFEMDSDRLRLPLWLLFCVSVQGYDDGYDGEYDDESYEGYDDNYSNQSKRCTLHFFKDILSQNELINVYFHSKNLSRCLIRNIFFLLQCLRILWIWTRQ